MTKSAFIRGSAANGRVQDTVSYDTRFSGWRRPCRHSRSARPLPTAPSKSQVSGPDPGEVDAGRRPTRPRSDAETGCEAARRPPVDARDKPGHDDPPGRRPAPNRAPQASSCGTRTGRLPTGPPVPARPLSSALSAPAPDGDPPTSRTAPGRSPQVRSSRTRMGQVLSEPSRLITRPSPHRPRPAKASADSVAVPRQRQVSLLLMVGEAGLEKLDAVQERSHRLPHRVGHQMVLEVDAPVA